MSKWFAALCMIWLPLSALAANSPVYAVPEAERDRADLATLLVPVSLDLEMVDGMDYPGLRAFVRKGDSAFRVLPGEREIAVKYNQLFQIDADNHEVVRSKIIVLRFMAEPGHTYRATHASFRNVEQARAAMKNFGISVVDEAGINRVTSASQVQKNWAGEAVTTTRADLVGATAAAPATAAVASPAAPVVAVPGALPVPVPVQASPAADTPAAIRSLDLLRFAWQGASAAELAAILEWVKANP